MVPANDVLIKFKLKFSSQSEMCGGDVKILFYNSKNFLIISENVRMKDIRGTILAEKLIFDIKKNKLNISSSDDKKINANINYK